MAESGSSTEEDDLLAAEFAPEPSSYIEETPVATPAGPATPDNPADSHDSATPADDPDPIDPDGPRQRSHQPTPHTSPFADLLNHPRARTLVTVTLAFLAFLLISILMWWHVWSGHPTNTAACECGDPSLFIWFLRWPAYALTHGRSLFFSDAMFHGRGINLLSNTSVLGIGVPLIPVTLLFGPVASLNVALTVSPALSAAAVFWLVRRWAPWTPAAFLAGLFYGFSPFIISSLAYAHLMTASLMIPPLVVGCLDELVICQQHRPKRVGAVLGLLLIIEFFVSTEVLLIMVMSAAIGLLLLAVYSRLAEPEAFRARWRGAVTGGVTGLVVAGVVLAYPAWYALFGPDHFSGAVWPELPLIAGFTWGAFFHAMTAGQASFFDEILGYLGRPLASAAYIGFGVPLVLLAGAIWWRRDRRLWFFGVMAVVTALLSIGHGKHGFSLWRPVEHLPLLENIGQQRFVTMSFLALAIALGIILDHAHRTIPGHLAPRLSRTTSPQTTSPRTTSPQTTSPRTTSPRSTGRRAPTGTLIAVAAAAIALVPIAAVTLPTLPFDVQPVYVPAWYTDVGAHLPPGQVVLAYPAPFSGAQAALTWQAVANLRFDVAGGGGPEDLPARAGSTRAGQKVLTDLAFGLDTPDVTAKPLDAVRHSLSAWGVTIVVVPEPDGQSTLVTGKSPDVAAGYMTAVIGSLPTLVEGSWVWDSVQRAGPPLTLPAGTLAGCFAEAYTSHDNRPMAIPRCVINTPGATHPARDHAPQP